MAAFHCSFLKREIALKLYKAETTIQSKIQRDKEFAALTTASAADSAVKLFSQIKRFGVTLHVNLVACADKNVRKA